ncbi:MAG: hypothetical protein CSA52_00600 [Gammaproteobacteria bacterium]|nr:MAG: hypothetical protein CSB48_06570 [Pseudomonadota bacterium]PIE38915.1 MAG: hypothetical protein CSA52_00600 [Gammaproteobacteria bacterium]
MQYQTIGQFTLAIKLVGQWSLEEGLSAINDVTGRFSDSSALRKIIVNGNSLTGWDSCLVSYLLLLVRFSKENGITLEFENVPQGAVRLVSLAESAADNVNSEVVGISGFSLTETVGKRTLTIIREASHFTEFVGKAVIAFVNFFRGRAVYRRSDFWGFVEDTGPGSLPIVTLISVLMGMILAFVGAVQLEKFGASVYVASLVGLSMAREMGAMMTAIIMAGRTGAAYAAQLGSMQVNEEIDALRTMGVAPMEFLVVPRMLALVLMLPLLTIYANLMGILGGALVSIVMLDITWSMYIEQMMSTVPLVHFMIGLFKSVLFGMVIALSGCFMGMFSARSASGVGKSTTNAVVLGIVLIVVADSLVTIATTVLGI